MAMCSRFANCSASQRCYKIKNISRTRNPGDIFLPANLLVLQNKLIIVDEQARPAVKKRKDRMSKKVRVFTIGHSTRPIDEFLEILKHYAINELVDIRTIPKSRHNPQYNGPELAHVLRNHHIGYRHEKDLGGLRHTHVGSINMGWRNASFRGYADYMQTDEFKKGIEKLVEIAHEKTVVIMCSEAVPWRCHRSLVGDALLVRGFDVEDIYSLTEVKPHALTPWAEVHGTAITYPAPAKPEDDNE